MQSLSLEGIGGRGGEREQQQARLTAATLNALHELAIASGTRGVDAVARLAADHARSLLDVDAAVVFSHDVDRRVLVPVAETDATVPEAPVPPGEGAIGLAFETGLPIVVNDYQRWERALPASARRGMVSAIAVPLIAGDRPVGALGVWTYRQREFTAEQEQLLTLFAAQVAPALEAARLNQQRSETARIFEALHDLAVAAGGTHDPSEVAALCALKVLDVLRADGATVTWWDPDQRVLRSLADAGIAGSMESRLRPGEGAHGVAFKWKEPVVVTDYRTWPHATSHGRDSQIRSAVCVPLIVRDRAVGALGAHTFEERSFVAAEVEILNLFAAQIAPALEAARLIETSAAQVRELRTLHDIAVAASGVLEPRRLASAVVRDACALLGADRAVLRTWDPESQLLVSLADSAGVELPPVKLGDGVAGLVFDAGRPMTIEDYTRWTGADAWARAAGFAGAVMVPLVSNQRPTGVLGAFTTTPRPFGDAEIRLLSLLAAQVAPALEAAQLADSLQERARVFAALHELAVAAGGLLDPVGLARLTSERARDLLGVDRVSVEVYDEATGELRAIADSSAVEAAAAAATPGAVLTMPIVAGDTRLGIIAASSMQPRRFTEEDERLLSLLVSQLAPAMVGARLHSDLATSERALRAIYDTASVAIARNSLDGRLIWMNRAGCELFGYTESELRRLGRRELLAPEDVDLDAGRLAELVAGRLDRYRLERRYVKKDGSRFWGDVTIGLVRRPDGAPDFYYAMVEDITERRTAETARRESEERFRAVFDRAAIGIAHLDLDGRVTDANPALHRILGRPDGSLRGRPFDDHVHPEDRGALHVHRLAAGEASEHQVDMRYVTAGGSEVWGNTIASAVRGDAGEPRFVLVIVEDVTHRKEHEARLEHRALHDPLTDLPNRTLLHDRLEQAIRAARRGGEVGAVLVIDLDGFKQVNDQHGHHCGDDLLRQIGERMRGELRNSDTVARLGGDEFAVVLPAIGGAGGASRAAAKLTRSLEQPFTVDGHEVRVSASIGSALFPSHGDDPDSLLRRADASMYDDKRSRR